MLVMELFHGSSIIIESPERGKGNPQNDYGLGFYCTGNIELAKEWACKTPRDGFANRYSIDMSGLEVLDLMSGEWHILNWLAILLENRSFEIGTPIARDAKDYILHTFLPDYRRFDVIRGYRADDSYFSYAKAFLNGGIPLDALSDAMKLGKLGEQICIRSDEAFKSLHFIDAAVADGQEYYIRRNARDRKAREDYLRLLDLAGNNRNAVYIIDILRQEWQDDDERLR